MTNEYTAEWCLKMAELEGDAEIGAGHLARIPDVDEVPFPAVEPGETMIAFGRFVRLMRRSQHLSIEDLADRADVDLVELVGIEDDAHYKPEVRTVHQIASVFNLPRANLLQVAGLTNPRNTNLIGEAVRFAARSEAMTDLTSEERVALEAFISVLSEEAEGA